MRGSHVSHGDQAENPAQWTFVEQCFCLDTIHVVSTLLSL